MSLAIAAHKKAARRELGEECYPIAYVTGGDIDGTKCYLNPDKNGDCKRIDLPINSHFLIEPVNDPNKQECGWLWGQSGCGKSTLLARYMLRYTANADVRAITLMYRKLAKQRHTDKGGSEDDSDIRELDAVYYARGLGRRRSGKSLVHDRPSDQVG